MKYRNKNYVSIGTCFVFILPIILFTASLTYCLSDTFHTKPLDEYPSPRIDLTADHHEFPIDTPEFQTGDEALFNFTGDTVLVLSQSSTEPDDEVSVLHKTPQGGFETVDLPDNWLVKIPTDTLPARKPLTAK
jgi:hypothetical protein